MYFIVYETLDENPKYRIVQVAASDCIVEEVDEQGDWKPVGDDSVCAQIYMEAFLHARHLRRIP